MQAKPTDIIILRGAPGSGKSQTAKSLTQFFPKGVRLEVDTIRQMVVSVDWKNQQEHIKMLQVSAGLVCDFLKSGFRPVIVVDTFSGDKVFGFMDRIRHFDSNLAISVFGLFTTGDELERRLALRQNGEFRDVAVCKKLNNDVLKIKHKTELQIDTTGLLPVETARRIYEHLSFSAKSGVPIQKTSGK
jgi:chloramphenicol 3-O-phosphotransferase